MYVMCVCKCNFMRKNVAPDDANNNTLLIHISKDFNLERILFFFFFCKILRMHKV